MQGASILFEYPEFFAIGIIGLLLLRARTLQAGEMQLPGFLSSPSVSIMRALPSGYVSWILTMQNWAGWRSNSAFPDFCAAKFLIFLVALFSAALIPFYVAGALALLLFFAPDLFLISAVKRRQESIRTSLPQALDLMVLCVDAGLGLDATLQRIAADQSTINIELNEELTILGRDVLLGMERERAYQEIFKRTGVDELKMLGSALNQCTKMGLSIAKILRVQAEFLRSRRHQKAEEKAAKLPIWMSFPLWFCIMPALLVLLLGPSLIGFMQQFTSHFPPGLFHQF